MDGEDRWRIGHRCCRQFWLECVLGYFFKFKTVTFKFILPILLIVLTLFNLFNVYDRILKAIGISSFQFEADYTDDNIEDGRKLVKEGFK